jgi:hypothetical protein
MSKLLLIYLLSKGGHVAVGDKVLINGDTVEVTSLNVHSINIVTSDSRLITIEKFGFRGEVSIDGLSPDFPVDTETGIVRAFHVNWDKIVCWKPCIKTLIKMQTLAEDEASENLLNAVHEQSLLDIASEEMTAEIKKFNEVEIMEDQLKFTVENKRLIGKPLVDMLARVEYDHHDCGLVVHDFTLKFETETEYCGVDMHGYCVAISKDEFIAFHPVNEQ